MRSLQRAAGAADAYLAVPAAWARAATNRDAAELRGHYASEHHPCREGECGETGMVAFASEQELRDHVLARHSSKMPRFKK